MAERQGFEPWEGYKPSTVFKTVAFNHSATSPRYFCFLRLPLVEWATGSNNIKKFGVFQFFNGNGLPDMISWAQIIYPDNEPGLSHYPRANELKPVKWKKQEVPAAYLQVQ